MARYIYTHGLGPCSSVFPCKSMRARVHVSDPFIIKQTDKLGLYDCYQRRPTAAVYTRLGFWQNCSRTVEYIAGSQSTRSVSGSLYTDSTRMPVFSHTKVCVHGSDSSDSYRHIKYVYMNVINVDQLSQCRRIDAARVLWKNFPRTAEYTAPSHS